MTEKNFDTRFLVLVSLLAILAFGGMGALMQRCSATRHTPIRQNFYCDSRLQLMVGLDEPVIVEGDPVWCRQPLPEEEEPLLLKAICVCKEWGEAAFSRQIICRPEGGCTPSHAWMTKGEYQKLFPMIRPSDELWLPP